ncbi:MAG: amidohydrolase family protein [Planctomycetales bacterium]|nr:amidohydrolase family protein [Planctomycetales bacterium]
MQQNHESTCIDRRQMLATTVAAGAGALLWPGHGEANTVAEHPWIDAHSHIWTRDIEKFPLAKGQTLDDLSPPSFTTEELVEVARANGVGRVVLIQHGPYHGWDNSYVIHAARAFPKAFRVVAMVDHYSQSPGQQMRRMLDDRVTGFRIRSSERDRDWLGGNMGEMWRTAADTGQNICGLINPEFIAPLDAMCQKHPETPVVIDHFARIGMSGAIEGSQIDELCRLARHKRVTVKLSAFYALGRKEPPYLDLVPMIRRLLDAFGVERLMWASDSPYQLQGKNNYAASIALIRDRLDFISESDRDWLLRKTAERVFFFV